MSVSLLVHRPYDHQIRRRCKRPRCPLCSRCRVWCTIDARRTAPAGRRPACVSVEFPPMPTMTTSDSQGRYRISGLTGGNRKVIVQKEGYSQPCRAALNSLQRQRPRYLRRVQRNCLQTGLPVSIPITQPVLTGFVFERTSSGVKPVAGAHVSVDFSGGFGGWEPSATTMTDAAGRFLLCGVATTTGLSAK